MEPQFVHRLLHGFNLDDPLQLISAAHLCVGICFALRGKSEHSKLLIGQFLHGSDAKGRRFIRFSPHFSKIKKGLKVTSHQLPRILYQLDEHNRYDPYNIITTYINKLPKGYKGFFYLRPRTASISLFAEDGSGAAWYNPNHVLGQNEIGKMLAIQWTKLGERGAPGGLDKCVPYCLRRAAVSNCINSGINSRALPVSVFLYFLFLTYNRHNFISLELMPSENN